MTQSLKQQVRAAIKRGEIDLALQLLRGLENPKPPSPQRVSYLNRPYYNSKLRYEK
jgi:hypothetical protein